MKINILRRKLIKPSIPTPQTLRNYKISLRDELSPPSNVGVVLFYRSKPKLAGLLEESLSRILPQFYPLAGRYMKQDYTVDCRDQGVEFVEAVATADYAGEVDDFLPRRGGRFAGPTDPLLSIQITELIELGGVAVGVSVSHRVFDASSMGTFIAAWSNASKNAGGEEITIVPSFEPHLLFPGKKRSYFAETEPSEAIVSKRFLFKKESIMNLRSKLKPEEGVAVELSKVRVVSALIAKALLRVDQIKYGRPRASLIVQAVDMRHRTIPPLPKHSCGNLVLHSVAKCMQPAAELGIQEIACMISDTIGDTVSDCAKVFRLGEDGYEDFIIKPEADLIEALKSSELSDLWFSDWSKFGLYEADFGWGKPVSVGVGTVCYERVTVLMSNRDGDGIEAWVHLRAKDMLYFQQDEEIEFYTT